MVYSQINIDASMDLKNRSSVTSVIVRDMHDSVQDFFLTEKLVFP